jgi:hypothetical protein
VGDYVWEDQDRDGVQDANEPGIPGVVVTLYDASGAVVRTATTDAAGHYMFEGVPPGTYTAGFSLPTGYERLPALGASLPGANGRTPSFTVDPGTTRSDIDAGYFRRVFFSCQLLF